MHITQENALLTELEESIHVALEETEAVYWSKYYDINDSLPCFVNIICGAFAGSIPDLDILALNRVIGLGMNGHVSASHIDEVINFYRKAGAKRFFIQLSPNVFQTDLPYILKEKGFKHHNNWVKLLKKDEIIPEVKTDLRVLPVGKEEAETYGMIIHKCFDWEDIRLKDWLQKTIGKSGYYHYLAYDGHKPVAAAALHISGLFASMAFAGTLEEYRGRGAQSLLLKTRLLKAIELGCKYFVSETAETMPLKPVASYQNMRRFGFEEAYLRQNWIFTL